MGDLKHRGVWHFVHKDLASPLRHNWGGKTRMQFYGLFAADFILGHTHTNASVGFHAPDGVNWTDTVYLIWDQERGLLLQ